MLCTYDCLVWQLVSECSCRLKNDFYCSVAQKCGKRKVLIVDWDIHHGNGTQVGARQCVETNISSENVAHVSTPSCVVHNTHTCAPRKFSRKMIPFYFFQCTAMEGGSTPGVTAVS